MLRKIGAWSLACALLAVLPGCHPGEDTREQEQPRIVDLEDFFRNPEETGYDLSPDGEHIAFLKPWEGRLNIHVQKIGSDEVTRLTDATERDIRGFLWLNNNRIGWIQDKAGDENWHAYAVDVDGSNYLDATPFDGVQVRPVDRLENDDDHMLISMNKRDRQIFDVYRMNVNSGELTAVAKNPGNISSWVTDNEGRIRVATTTDGVNTSLLYRETESDPFEVVVTTNFKDSIGPLFFDFENKLLYVSSNIDRDKSAIFRFDPATGERHGKI